MHRNLRRPAKKRNKPPAYRTLRPSEDAAAQNELHFDRTRPRDWFKGKPNLVLTFTSSESRPRPGLFSMKRRTASFWRAKLSVHCDNIPGLMLGGFHWSPTCELSAAGSVDIKRSRLLGPHVRRYQLKSPVRDPSDWRAVLEVRSAEEALVTGFDLTWVTRDFITEAQAWNWAGERVYAYDVRRGLRFNTVYDRMPMVGLWPLNEAAGKGQVGQRGSWERFEEEACV